MSFFFFCCLLFAKSNWGSQSSHRFPVGNGAGTLPRASYCEEFLRQYTCWLLRSHSSQQPAKTLPEKHPQEPLPVVCRCSLSSSSSSSVPTVSRSWRVPPRWPPPLLTSGFAVVLPAKPRAWSVLSGGRILSPQWKLCAIKRIENSMKGETKQIWPDALECKLKIIMAVVVIHLS